MPAAQSNSHALKSLILIHGWGTNSAIWLPILPLLKAHFQVTVMDLPGFGFNTDNDHLGSLASIAKYIANEIEIPSVIAGWSFGGLVSTQIALDYPERCTHLINIASTPKFNADKITWSAGIAELELSRFRQALEKNPLKTLHDFIDLQLRGTMLDKQKILQLKLTLRAFTPTTLAMKKTLRLLKTTDLRKDVKYLEAPTLYLFGDKDSFIPSNTIHQIYENCPTHEYQIIPRATHAPFLSRPEIFRQHLLKFCGIAT